MSFADDERAVAAFLGGTAPTLGVEGRAREILGWHQARVSRAKVAAIVLSRVGSRADRMSCAAATAREILEEKRVALERAVPV